MGKGIINFDVEKTNELLAYVAQIKEDGINIDAPKDGNLYGQKDGEWEQAQEQLESGKNIKTLNGVSVLGEGNIDIAPTIGENGNWFINGKDTGKPANGKDGADGVSLGEIALVQETGTGEGSENKVMSQEAVTKELTKLSNNISNAKDDIISSNINAPSNLPINYNTANGTESQLINGGYEGVSLYVDENSPFSPYLKYGLKLESAKGYFSFQNPTEVKKAILDGAKELILSFWINTENIDESSTFITIGIFGNFLANKFLNSLDGLSDSYDGTYVSYDYEIKFSKTKGKYKNLCVKLKNISNKSLTESDNNFISVSSVSTINSFITNLTILAGNDLTFNEYLIYPDKNGELFYSLPLAKQESEEQKKLIQQNTSSIKDIEDSNVSITEENVNKNVGTDNETALVNDSNLALTEDTDSPLSSVLKNCLKGLGKPKIFLIDYKEKDFDTIIFSIWINANSVTSSIGLYASVNLSIRYPSFLNISFGSGQKKLSTLKEGDIFSSEIDNDVMTADTTFECCNIINGWYRLVGTLKNINWKIEKSNLTELTVNFGANFADSGFMLFQNTTVLVGNKLEYRYNPINLIYPDGINQVQYPYSAASVAEIALKNKDSIKKIEEDLSNSSGSPLKGKYIAWVADSLLEGCANIVDGEAVPQNYNTLDDADKDEKALGYAAGWVANGSNTSYNVNWPYWISKRTRCINHILGQSGQTIFSWAADNAKEYFYWYYKTIGRIVGYKSSYDREDIAYSADDGQYALRGEYIPDFIILSFGTNDNMYLVNVDTLPTLDSLPPEGGDEYINKTYKLTTDGTFWSWKDDGTGGEGIPHYSWVQVYPKTIGSYETAWKEGKWDETTLWGCYAKVITYYRQKWPNVKMGIILDGNTSREQRNAFLRICKTFAIGFLDLQTLPYPPMYNNIRGYSISGETYKQGNDFPKGCIVKKDGEDYISLCDIPANSEWDASKWGYSLDNTLKTKSPVALGQADRDNMPSITGRSEGNYSKGEDIFIWGDYQAMLCSYDLFVHPTLHNAKVKSQIVENWLLTL